MAGRDEPASGRDSPSSGRALARAGVAGSHSRYDDSAVRAFIRSVVNGERDALLGLDPLVGVTTDEAIAAVAEVWGWPDREPVASTDPRRTLEATGALVSRVTEVAGDGGTVVFATGRPASLLPLYGALARMARQEGGRVPTDHDVELTLCDGRAGRSLRWVEGTAVVTDGTALLPTRGVEAGEELLFQVGRPDLVVADHGFATSAFREGLEVGAFVDFDALALPVAAAARAAGPPTTLVPLDDQRPPLAYEVLIGLVSGSS